MLHTSAPNDASGALTAICFLTALTILIYRQHHDYNFLNEAQIGEQVTLL